MGWRECTAERMLQGAERSDWFGWALVDCREGFTVADLWSGALWWLTLPGDWLLNLPKVRTFFEIEHVAPYVGFFGSYLILIALVFGIGETLIRGVRAIALRQ